MQALQASESEKDKAESLLELLTLLSTQTQQKLAGERQNRIVLMKSMHDQSKRGKLIRPASLEPLSK